MSAFRLVRFATIAAAVCAIPVLAAAQASGQQPPPAPKPGPEHEIMKMDAGTWDAVVEFIPGPGATPVSGKGVETNTVGCGGLCMITDFKGETMGSPFEGHGLMVWDSAKKKYTGVWTDSMSTGLAQMESTYDPATKKWSGWMEGPDMTGKMMKTRNAMEMKDANTRVMTAFASGPDGKEMQVMKITYTRRK